MPEAQRILAVAAGRRNGARFALALALGLRQGKALGLQWRDVELDRGPLTIRCATQRLVWQHAAAALRPEARRRLPDPGTVAAWSSPR